MINYDNVTKEKIKEHNINWSQVLNHAHRILTIGGWESENKALLNLTKQQNDDDFNIIDQIYFYVKDPKEANYQHIIKNMKMGYWRARISKNSDWIFK